ncbi:MAG TPA: hypothetical protein DDZ81_04475 [Acetobacteraceae bacterium]|jgi:hypothetical protein|nr:hypothetical protein [Acetobacteraceae bacterium]
MPASEDYTLEFLLAFDGRIHCLGQGHWLKFEIRRTPPTPERPHGLRYSFTLHDRTGRRLLGFDNAHRVAPHGSRFQRSDTTHDHWHRTGGDEGRPYRFTTAEQLLVDFEAAVEKCLAERGTDIGTTGDTAVAEWRS